MTPDLVRLCQAAETAYAELVPFDGLHRDESEAIVLAVLAELSPPSPAMIAAAWAAWRSRHGNKLGPGPAFQEALAAALGSVIGESGP